MNVDDRGHDRAFQKGSQKALPKNRAKEQGQMDKVALDNALSGGSYRLRRGQASVVCAVAMRKLNELWQGELWGAFAGGLG
jgi:hypothetical protein